MRAHQAVECVQAIDVCRTACGPNLPSQHCHCGRLACTSRHTLLRTTNKQCVTAEHRTGAQVVSAGNCCLQLGISQAPAWLEPSSPKCSPAGTPRERSCTAACCQLHARLLSIHSTSQVDNAEQPKLCAWDPVYSSFSTQEGSYMPLPAPLAWVPTFAGLHKPRL